MGPVKRIISKQLGELLLERGLIKKEELEKALQVQREKGGLLGQILIKMNIVTEEEIAHIITVQYGFPYLPLSCYEIDDECIKLIPENVSRQYCLIGIDKIGSTLTVAMSNPLNNQAIEDIELMTSCRVQMFVSTMSDINKAIDKYYKKSSK